MKEKCLQLSNMDTSEWELIKSTKLAIYRSLIRMVNPSLVKINLAIYPKSSTCKIIIFNDKELTSAKKKHYMQLFDKIKNHELTKYNSKMKFELKIMAHSKSKIDNSNATIMVFKRRTPYTDKINWDNIYGEDEKYT